MILLNLWSRKESCLLSLCCYTADTLFLSFWTFILAASFAGFAGILLWLYMLFLVGVYIDVFDNIRRLNKGPNPYKKQRGLKVASINSVLI